MTDSAPVLLLVMFLVGAVRRQRRHPVTAWDGLCGHPSGLRTAAEMVNIARAKVKAMEDHPGLAWLRREDETARAGRATPEWVRALTAPHRKLLGMSR